MSHVSNIDVTSNSVRVRRRVNAMAKESNGATLRRVCFGYVFYYTFVFYYGGGLFRSAEPFWVCGGRLYGRFRQFWVSSGSVMDSSGCVVRVSFCLNIDVVEMMLEVSFWYRVFWMFLKFLDKSIFF